MGPFQDWSGKLIGDYRLLRPLGSGSFGEVYQAEDLREHIQVAVKLIKAPLTQHEDLKAFLNEARSIRLRHPHIVPLLDFGISEQELPFLVMEYVAGGTLRQRYPKGSSVPLERVVEMTTQLASALQYAHDRHLVHRDVKPENMLCRSDDTVLLSDFGIASVAHATDSASAYQAFGGTLPYMAPEQHSGKPRPASDQYALAVVVYEWLAGVRPFQGTVPELITQHLHAPPPSLLQQAPTLPVQVQQVVFKALAKQAQERFTRVEDFAQALQSASRKPHASLQPSSPPSLPTTPSASQTIMSNQVSRMNEETKNSFLSPVLSLPSELIEETENRPLPTLPPAIVDFAPRTAIPTPISTSQTDSRSTRGSSAVIAPVRQKSNRNKGLLFAVCAFLIVLLCGSGLWYIGSAVQKTIALQAAATMTVQEYATTTAKQGVMLGFDAAHTHYNPYEQLLRADNISQLSVLWSFHTGDSIYASPVVAGGLVYVGSEDGKLYAFDATCRGDCQPLWSFTTGNIIYSSPAVAGGLVYLGSGNKIYAFDATCQLECQPLWSYVTIGNAIYSSPTVAGGLVYVGSEDDKLYAFDAKCRMNCQPLWSFTTGKTIHSSPAVGGGLVYVGSEDDKLYAFDATCRAKCQPLWSFTTGNDIESSPALARGLVYVGSGDGKLYAFDATCRAKCQPLWNFAAGYSIISSPAVAGGLVYLGTSDGKLYAFDATCRAKCQPLWHFAGGYNIDSSPAVANGLIYIGSDNYNLYAFGLAS